MCRYVSFTGPVRLLKTLKSFNNVNAFLGLASYCHRLIKGFTQITQPLHYLTHKGASFTWTRHCQKAFDHDQLKEKLVTALILACLIAKQGFLLETHVNKIGLGAALSQT